MSETECRECGAEMVDDTDILCAQCSFDAVEESDAERQRQQPWHPASRGWVG